MATVTTTTTAPAKVQSKPGSDKASEKSLVGDFNWQDVLVPEKAGTGLTKWHYQRRTLVQYACLFATGLTSFYKFQSPALRAASLGLLFPGAGFIAVFTVPSILSFVVSTALIPLVLFAWFGMGGLVFPIILWVGTAALSALLARESVLELAGPLMAAFCVGGLVYLTYSTQRANAEARNKRQARNNFLLDEVRNNQTQASLAPKAGTREVDEQTLRFVQWFVELGLTPKDDFSYHDVVDQFQTAAIRYQLYETINVLGLYQSVYCPNFRGYLSQAQINAIDKSCTKKVMEFWKYESMAGKFNAHDWDPIKKDNIMVTGYILQAVGIYQSNTGDDRYTKPGSLVFEITDSIKYPYDIKGVADAVHRNMDEAAYCLYPCEPNWLYTPCNLVGIGGILLTDRLLGNTYGEHLRERFEHALETEFTNPDGSILPIRSELTGFTIPGLAGALSDGVNSMLCASYLPHIAHRNWAFTKKETLRYNDSTGRLEVHNLLGADKLDAGNYKPGEGAIRCVLAAAAAEYGDEGLRTELLRQIDEEFHPVFTTKTGALKNKGVSTLWQGTTTRARLGRYQDWVEMIKQGPLEMTKKGPMLEECPFPEVLVAKCYSRDGEGLDLVLYPGREAGVFTLGFKSCKAGGKYSLLGKEAEADTDGVVRFEVKIDGRTEGKLEHIK